MLVSRDGHVRKGGGYGCPCRPTAVLLTIESSYHTEGSITVRSSVEHYYPVAVYACQYHYSTCHLTPPLFLLYTASC